MTPPSQFDSRLPFRFAVAAFLVGNGFVFFNPPIAAPDEWSHFARAFRLSQLHPLSLERDGILTGAVPVSIMTLYEKFGRVTYSGTSISRILQASHIPLDPDNVVFPNFFGTARYPPVPFIPQAIGIALGRLFFRSVLLLMYCGRESNLIFYIALVYAALCLVPDPRPRLILGLIALLPTSLYLAGSLSADALNIADTILVAALFWRLMFVGDVASKLDRVMLFGSSIGLALMKVAYCPLLLLMLAVPVKKLGGPRRYIAFLGSLLLCNALVILLWMSQFNGLPGVNPDPSVNPHDQLQFLLHNPAKIVPILAATARTHGAELAAGVIGVFGWNELPLPVSVVVIFYLLLLLAIAPFSPPRSRAAAIVASLLAASIFAGILLIYYLDWRRVGESPIDGFQSRYLVPLLPLLIFVAGSRKELPKHSRLIFTAAVLIGAYSIIFLIQQLYPAFPGSRFYYRFSGL